MMAIRGQGKEEVTIGHGALARSYRATAGRWAVAAHREEEEGVKKRNRVFNPLKLGIATGQVRLE